jgi:sugar phosphate permease
MARTEARQGLATQQARAFALTFLSYAVLTACRAPYAICKAPLLASGSATPFGSGRDGALWLGLCDSAFLTAYSLGLFVSGTLADRARDVRRSSIREGGGGL